MLERKSSCASSARRRGRFGIGGSARCGRILRGAALAGALVLGPVLGPVLGSVLGLVLLGPARGWAQTLDSVFPVGVPGFGAAPGVSVLSRLHRGTLPRGITDGALAIYPSLALGAGVDTAPAAGSGSAMLTATPSVRLADPALGFGGFASDTVERWPGRPGLDSNSLSAALGETLKFGADRLTLGVGRADLGETALGVSPVGAGGSGTAPYRLVVDDARAALVLPEGALDVTLRGGIEAARLSRSGGGEGLVLPFATERQLHGSLTVETAPGPPLRFVGEMRARGVRYRGIAAGSGIGDSTRLSLLAGVATSEVALWSVRALAGVVQRIGVGPGRRAAPIVEMALDWTPDAISAVELRVTRRLDPAAVLGAPDTVVTSEHLTGALAYDRDLTVTAGIAAREAALGGVPSHEIDVHAGARWRLSRLLALAPVARLAVRHDVAGAADREARLSLELVVTP